MYRARAGAPAVIFPAHNGPGDRYGDGMRDAERIERVTRALRAANLDAVACALPMHVLLLTSNWPVLGTSIAVATREGAVGMVVPEDEVDVIESGTLDALQTFTTGSVEALTPTSSLVVEPLRELCRCLGLKSGRVGYEARENVVPATYASMHVYGMSIREVVEQGMAGLEPVGADEMLYHLVAVKTPHEIERIRAAATIAERAFHLGSERLQTGMTEAEAAINFRLWLSTWRDNPRGTIRADGFVFCMSGPNAAQAWRPFQRTGDRVLRNGDLVVIHCNNFSDGYWTDITRTYCIGEPDARARRMYQAVFDARRAALEAVRPGATTATVWQAAHKVLADEGFAAQSRHSLGHGVGFHAINHHARPVIHPHSKDVLEEGMVFSLVPAIYLESQGGLRHCDMVTVTADGVEVLTPFQSDPYALQVLGTAGY